MLGARAGNLSSGPTQGCQMKISIKCQTMLKRGQKKAKPIVKGQKKCQTVFAVLPCLCHKKTFKLQEKKYLKLRLSLAWHCTGAHCFSDSSWFVRMHTLGKTVRQFVHRSFGSFLHPHESHLPFTPILTTRIITAQCHCCISIAKRPACLHALSLLISYNTVHTTQCSECTSLQCLRKILLKSESGRRPNIAFITKILQICCQKNGIVVFSFIGIYFSDKRPKKSQKAKRIF